MSGDPGGHAQVCAGAPRTCSALFLALALGSLEASPPYGLEGALPLTVWETGALL